MVTMEQPVASVCPLCGAAQFRPFRFGLLRCAGCEFVVDPRIFTPQLDQQLNEEAFGEGYEPQRSFWVRWFEAWKNRRYLANLRWAGVTGGRLLEVGVGSGGFLLAAREAGFEPMGCELSQSLAQRVAARPGRRGARGRAKHSLLGSEAAGMELLRVLPPGLFRSRHSAAYAGTGGVCRRPHGEPREFLDLVSHARSDRCRRPFDGAPATGPGAHRPCAALVAARRASVSSLYARQRSAELAFAHGAGTARLRRRADRCHLYSDKA